MSTFATFPQLFGHFRVLRKLGEGGMGAVYLAEDTQLRCQVALKIPLVREGDGPKLIERFHREARLAQSVHHPYICPVYAVGEIEGVHYLTMPFIEGNALSRLVGPERCWKQEEAAELVRRLALALQTLHERQVIHRDLKPHNIMLRADGAPMLMDFGLACALGGEGPRFTTTGKALGTPAYMPPELANGDGKAMSPATDVYSLGMILFELLTGRLPFDAPDLRVLFYQILMVPPPSPTTLRADLDRELEAVCLKTLAKEPKERHTGMAELAADLDAYLRGVAARQPPAMTVEKVPASEELRVACPQCGRRLKVPPAFVGKRMRCPGCQGRFEVPADPQATLTPISMSIRELPPLAPPAAPKARRAGEILMSSLGMKLAWIPPGSFLMGSPASEAKRNDDETQHRVTLTKGFCMGIHPVTQGQWRAVMGYNPSHFKGDDRPVEMVSWEDCQEFCKKLGAKEGKAYRLPTEAEWEYACRAGTTTPFSFGETITTDQVNYDGNYPYGKGKKGEYRQQTTLVGSFPANAWGLHDMHGNVAEWCQDWYGPYPDKDIKDPQSVNSGKARVLRGGSWSYDARYCRSARRYRDAPGYRRQILGVRVCACQD